MSTTKEAAPLFECLSKERLATVAAKLRQLPTGSEFERRVETAISSTVGIEDRTYEAIVDDHGDLVGFADQDEERLPWWLDDFEWTVTADPLDSLTIDARSLEQFEDYPLDSTVVEDISLSGADSVVKGLNAFAALEETLAAALGESAGASQDEQFSDYPLPDKLFVVPERGRIDTSDAFKTWFEQMVNLCPPGCPELSALLRVNTNVQRKHAEQVLDEAELERLTDLSVVEGSGPTTQTFNEDYHEPLNTLLAITPPFDLRLEVGNEKNDLSALQYAYYRGWAKDTDRLSEEQRWLRKAQNLDGIDETEAYRFAEFGFRLPIRISKSNVVFEGQERFGSSNESEAIGEVLEEFGHPVNDD